MVRLTFGFGGGFSFTGRTYFKRKQLGRKRQQSVRLWNSGVSINLTVISWYMINAQYFSVATIQSNAPCLSGLKLERKQDNSFGKKDSNFGRHSFTLSDSVIETLEVSIRDSQPFLEQNPRSYVFGM